LTISPGHGQFRGAETPGVGDQLVDLGVAAVGDQIRRSPFLASGKEITAWRASGQRFEHRSSEAVRETISPPILAKRLTRPGW